MDWIGVTIVVGLLLFTGGVIYKTVNNPAFWFRLFSDLTKLIGPVVWAYVSRPEDEETRKRRIAVQRRGGEWDPFRKREREKR